MVLLSKYEDFLDRVDELGFMSFSNIMPGLPSLSRETPSGIWHTGDHETDPWRWKDRAAEDKKLAFGCILGGHKGFIAARMYPLFYKAFHPQEHMEERRAAGQLNQTVWQLWQLFETKTLMDTGDVRRYLEVTKKKGAGRVDAAITELQKTFNITVAGSRQKLDKFGQPYGWHINIYDRVENWAPEGWLSLNAGINVEDAREAILDTAYAMGKNIDRDALAKKLGIMSAS
jgi:hypothetical protein